MKEGAKKLFIIYCALLLGGIDRIDIDEVIKLKYYVVVYIRYRE